MSYLPGFPFLNDQLVMDVLYEIVKIYQKKMRNI